MGQILDLLRPVSVHFGSPNLCAKSDMSDLKYLPYSALYQVAYTNYTNLCVGSKFCELFNNTDLSLIAVGEKTLIQHAVSLPHFAYSSISFVTFVVKYQDCSCFDLIKNVLSLVMSD